MVPPEGFGISGLTSSRGTLQFNKRDGQRGLASLLSRLTPQDANSYFVCVLNTQRAPDTRWGSIVGHRGVLEIFVCLVFFF